MVLTSPEVIYAMKYRGALTLSWTGADATHTRDLPTGRNIRFTGVKLEQVSGWDPMSGPVVSSAVFVTSPQIRVQGVDIINSVEKSVIGGSQFTGGAWLNISETFAPIKIASTNSDVIRGPFTVEILDCFGNLVVGKPVTTIWSVTISLWE
jgi:hypothetical protein